MTESFDSAMIKTAKHRIYTTNMGLIFLRTKFLLLFILVVLFAVACSPEPHYICEPTAEQRQTARAYLEDAFPEGRAYYPPPDTGALNGLVWAVETDRQDVVENFFKAGILEHEERGKTILHLGVLLSNRELVLAGLGCNADPNAGRFEYVEIPLMDIEDEAPLPLPGEDLEIEDYPAGVGRQRVEGITPLHDAARVGANEVARDLVAATADVNARTEGDVVPLHFAAARGNRGMIEMLIAGGAEPNASSEHGWTPLHVAAYEGLQNSVVALLELKADPRLENRDGDTPRQLAEKREHTELLELLD